MKLHLEDGRSIDTLAVAVYDELLRAVALIDIIDKESLIWLRSRISDLQDRDDRSQPLISALIGMINASIEEAKS